MIYVVRERLTKLIKVGWARTEKGVAGRLRTYRTHSPGDVDVVLVREGGRAQEADAHARLIPWHFRGEWFACSAHVAAAIVSAADLGERWVSPEAAGEIVGAHYKRVLDRATEAGATVVLERECDRFHYISAEWAHANVGLRRVVVRGTAQHHAKLNDEAVAEMRRRYAAGETRKALAREFGVTDATAENALKGKNWSHVPGAVAMRKGSVPMYGDANPRRSSPEKYAHLLGTGHPRARFTVEQIADVRRRHAAGETQASIARGHGVSLSTIHLIVKGRNWKTTETAPEAPTADDAARAAASNGYHARGDAHHSRRMPERVARGARNGSSKLTEESVAKIKARLRGGDRVADVARDFGVTPGAISMIKFERNWKHVA